VSILRLVTKFLNLIHFSFLVVKLMTTDELRHTCLSSLRLSFRFPVFLYVCPSVCPFSWNNSVPTGRIFMKFYIRGFLIYFERIQDRLKSDKITVFIMWKRTHIYNNISLDCFYNDKYFRQISREKQNALQINSECENSHKHN